MLLRSREPRLNVREVSRTRLGSGPRPELSHVNAYVDGRMGVTSDNIALPVFCQSNGHIL